MYGAGCTSMTFMTRTGWSLEARREHAGVTRGRCSPSLRRPVGPVGQLAEAQMIGGLCRVLSAESAAHVARQQCEAGARSGRAGRPACAHLSDNPSPWLTASLPPRRGRPPRSAAPLAPVCACSCRCMRRLLCRGAARVGALVRPASVTLTLTRGGACREAAGSTRCRLG
jgi:hypothetical protein